MRNHARGVFHFDVDSRNTVIRPPNFSRDFFGKGDVSVVDYGAAKVAEKAMEQVKC